MKKIIFILLFLVILFPLSTLAQGTAIDPVPAPGAADGTTADPTPVDPQGSSSLAPTPGGTTPAPTPKAAPKIATPTYMPEPVVAIDSMPYNPPSVAGSSDRKNVLVAAFSAAGFAVILFFGLNMRKKKDKENDKKCANLKQVMEDKLHELTDLKGQLESTAKKEMGDKIKNSIGGEAGNLLALIENAHKEYERLKELYEKCITDLPKTKNVFIFHGTEGYLEENWFPWLKEKLETKGIKVSVPQFPSPPGVPSKISEWFDVLKNHEDEINKETILIGHSLGGVFTLRILEKLKHPVKGVFLIGTPIGMKPILNYDRDSSFSGFDFDWSAIKNNSKHFVVFHSDNDPYVGLENGKELAKNLGVELSFVPNAGHFNKKAGYIKFEELWKKLQSLLNT